MLTGQNGILNRAAEAKEKTEQAQQEESDKTTMMEAMIQTAGTSIANPSSYGENPNAQATADGAGKYFALPTGAKYIEGTVDTGVVVNIKGSEFVWVPVEDVVLDESRVNELPTSSENGTVSGKKTYTPMAVKVGNDYKGLLYDFDGSNSWLMYGDNEKYQGGIQECREPSEVTYDIGEYKTEGISEELLTTEYNLMIVSVSRYKGFYVARYEAGIDKKTGKVVFKDASISENNVITTNAGRDENKMWYGLYKKMKMFSTDDEKIFSCMIWGSQYDAMMNWMTKNGKMVGNADDTKTNNDENRVTGINKTDIINNVFDLYGCHYEWTLEAYSQSCRTLRGGFYGEIVSPAHRNNDLSNVTSTCHSSRATILIK